MNFGNICNDTERGKEKWQIYANVVRKIYSEVGNLIEVDMGMRDLNRYIKAMRTGFYDPCENIDYEHKNKDNESSVNGNEINKNSEIGEEKIDNQINTKSDENADILENVSWPKETGNDGPPEEAMEIGTKIKKNGIELTLDSISYIISPFCFIRQYI